jgi:hypothetical protein
MTVTSFFSAVNGVVAFNLATIYCPSSVLPILTGATDARLFTPGGVKFIQPAPQLGIRLPLTFLPADYALAQGVSPTECDTTDMRALIEPFVSFISDSGVFAADRSVRWLDAQCGFSDAWLFLVQTEDIIDVHLFKRPSDMSEDDWLDCDMLNIPAVTHEIRVDAGGTSGHNRGNYFRWLTSEIL